MLSWLYSKTQLAYGLGVTFAIYETIVLVIVVAYLAFHVIERIDWYPFKIHYRTEKPIKPKEYETVTLNIQPFCDEDEDPGSLM